MYRPTYSSQQSPYQTISQSNTNSPQPAEFTPTQPQRSSQHIQLGKKNKCKPPRQDTKSPSIPIGTKSKQKLTKLKRSRQNTEEYFQKELEIRTLQSKKLLQELQESQKQVLKYEKECWMMQNQYEAEKRRMEIVMKQNAKLNEERAVFQQKVKDMNSMLLEKEESDKKYLENLESLKYELSQKETEITKLKLQNSILSKERSEYKQELEVRKQAQAKRQRQNSYLSRQINHSKTSSIDLESTTKSLGNRIVPSPYASIQAGIPSDRENFRYGQSTTKRQGSFNPYKTHENLQIRKLFENERHISYQNQRDLYRVERPYTFRNQQSHEPIYHSSSIQYPHPLQNHNCNRPPSISQRRCSYEYRNGIESKLSDVTNFNNQRLGSRRNRRDKMNDVILKRCKMMLHQY